MGDQSCTEGQGDCDSDSECSGSLTCGEDNCRDFNPDAEPSADCCINSDGGTGHCPYTDKNTYCEDWAKLGYCTDTYADYMALNCEKSCKCSGSAYDCEEVGWNYQGRVGARVVTGVEGWTQCLQHCREDSGCRYWVWNNAGAGVYAHGCALMTRYSNKAADTNTVAGPKTCNST